jgi:signal peptidase I
MLALQHFPLEMTVDHLHSQFIPDEPHSQPNGLRRMLRELLETLLLAVIIFIAINTATARILVQSISMQPNLVENDLVLVNRLAYLLSDPQRGEVIVFLNPLNPQDVPYIKRVIGLPGDTVAIDQGQVFVNGFLLKEPYLDIETQRGGQWQVPPGSLFVMGDNRNNSSDSRQWGMVPVESIIGRAEAVYWPLQHLQVLHMPSAEAAQP